MLQIRTTGVEDYLDGSANIKALIIGGPGAGKTRFSSYWPKPIFLDCENGRGSLADRNMPYAAVTSSAEMLDALEYLKSLQRTPKAARQFQTVVVDTVDSFQRLVKEEWVTANKAQAFSGFDAWGYLDTKMQLLLTRLLNLDYNVVVLSHFEVASYKDGDNTVRELKVQLQGKISEQIFNDFGLVGWLGTYWAAGESGRIQKRGLTFRPSPDRPFLKDRFNATPPMIDIVFADADYQQLFEAFFNRPEFESYGEGEVVGEIPTAVPENVAAPAEGGPTGRHLTLVKPTGAATTTAPAETTSGPVPLEKMLKADLEEVARAWGVTVKGNTLKAEIIDAIKHAQAAAAGAAPTNDDAGSSPEPTPGPTAAASPAADLWAPPPATPTNPASSPEASPSSTQPEPSSTPAASNSEAAPPAAASASSAVDLITERLGGEVISTEPADTPATPQPAPPSATTSAPSAQQGPSACADCGADLTADWQDPAKKNAMRMGFIKHRKYLCSTHLS